MVRMDRQIKPDGEGEQLYNHMLLDQMDQVQIGALPLAAKWLMCDFGQVNESLCLEFLAYRMGIIIVTTLWDYTED